MLINIPPEPVRFSVSIKDTRSFIPFAGKPSDPICFLMHTIPGDKSIPWVTDKSKLKIILTLIDGIELTLNKIMTMPKVLCIRNLFL